jgi:hypothetical protein
MMAGTRLILDVEVTSGDKHNSKHSAPGLWALLERLGRACWPALLRGDADWGTEANMSRAEQEGLAYLFKLRATAKVKALIAKLTGEGGWVEAGQGFEAREAELRLSGWSRQRRVVVLRRRLQRQAGVVGTQAAEGQQLLAFAEVEPGGELYEYAVLVTSVTNEPLTLAQLYRDRADAENVFDELKNQWGWGGFTTRDLKRCRLMARIQALVYDWWTLFARLIDPDHHREAITSRPLLLHAVARQTRHGKQTRLKITASHGTGREVRRSLARVSEFLSHIARTAGQSTDLERWCRILSRALEKYLKGRILDPPSEFLPA